MLRQSVGFRRPEERHGLIAQVGPVRVNEGLISVILPVHNQGDHIGRVVAGHEDALSRISSPHELILVENNSQDDSLGVCQELEREYARVRLIHSDEGGWGLAVKLGLEASRGDLLCYTNSARTTPQDLQVFLLYALANPDNVIKANRTTYDNWQRRLGSLLYNAWCRTLFDLPYRDINGSPKIFPRKFHKLLNFSQDDNLIDLEFSLICRREGYPMLEIPLLSNTRYGGTSTTTYGAAAKTFAGAYLLWRSERSGGR